MKMAIILSVFLLAFQMNAHAGINVNNDINYTGNEVGEAADFGSITPNSFTNLPLGGDVADDYVVEKAFQFTVNQPLVINDLSINAQLIPNPSVAPNNPAYNNPESMNVSFGLFQGTQAFGATQFPAPGNTNLALTNYTFSTIDGTTIANFNDLSLPINTTNLSPGNTYWLVTKDPQGGEGSTLNLQTSFSSAVATPEPSSLVLFILAIGFILFSYSYSKKKSF